MRTRRRLALPLVIAAMLVVPLIAIAVTSKSLWQAVDTPAYEYGMSVLTLSGTQFRAYWLGFKENGSANPGDFDSEAVFTNTSSVPWGFTTGASAALRTTGVRIRRYYNSATGDYRDMLNQTRAPVAGYDAGTTLGYLRRTAHAGSGAAYAVYECALPLGGYTDYFITLAPTQECVGLNSQLLGFAYSPGTPNTATFYRCVRSNPLDHLTSPHFDCGEHRDTYDPEGPVGNWKLGTTETVQGVTDDVSPFTDGAFTGPMSAILNDNGVYYLAYQGSGHYGWGGPFNQIFLATSSTGASFTPVTGADGMPAPIVSHASNYVSQVLGLNDTAVMLNSFGVGGGRLMKIGSTYRLFYIDSSRTPPVWKWATKTTSVITNWGTPSAAGTMIKDENGVDVTSNDYATTFANIVWDQYHSRFWLFRNDPFREHLYWHRSTDATGQRFYFATTGEWGEIPRPSGITHWMSGGAYTDTKGNVDGYWNWYQYPSYSSRTCTPSGGDNACGADAIWVVKFCPAPDPPQSNCQ